MLNKDEVQKLFNKERILVGNIDVIPKYAAKKIFGSEACDFASRLNRGNSNLYGIGDFSLEYLTYNGFQTAATFQNIKEAKEIVEGLECCESKKEV